MKSVIFVTVGRIDMNISPVSGLAFGSTFSSTPSGMVLMVGSAVGGVLPDWDAVPGVILKVTYTMFFATFTTAGWLLMTVTRGLESARTVPKRLMAWTATLKSLRGSSTPLTMLAV